MTPEVKQGLIQVAKVAGDISAASITVATVLQWLPAVAAIFTIIWTAIRIYETATVQKLLLWLRRRK